MPSYNCNDSIHNDITLSLKRFHYYYDDLNSSYITNQHSRNVKTPTYLLEVR